MKTGEISAPIRSPSGFHVISLLEKRGAETRLISQYRSRHILIRPNALLSEKQARRKLERLRSRILAGEDFAALARSHSDDTVSAHQGGDLGWAGPGMMVPPFEQAVEDLKKGQLSTPVKTQFGWHLIEVLERRQYDATDEFRRNQAREQIFMRKVDEARITWLNRLRSEAYVDNRLTP